MKTIAVPFTFQSDTGAVNYTESLDTIVRQNILDILSTSPGERVMNPKYGAGLRNLLFEELDPLVFAEYRMDAMQELNEYMTVGKVTDLKIDVPSNDFYGMEDDTTVRLSVKYVVPPYNSSVVVFNLSNSQTTLYGGA